MFKIEVLDRPSEVVQLDHGEPYFTKTPVDQEEQEPEVEKSTLKRVIKHRNKVIGEIKGPEIEEDE